ncbi:Sulfate permease, partial [Globisporangium splendens]
MRTALQDLKRRHEKRHLPPFVLCVFSLFPSFIPSTAMDEPTSHARVLSSVSVHNSATAAATKSPYRYVQLEDADRHAATSWAARYSPRRLWNDTIGHGLSRVTQSFQRARESSNSCATRTQRVRDAPKELVAMTKSAGRFYAQNWMLFQREVLAGVAAMLLMIPETIAFSYVANLDPVVGLYATGFFGIVVGLMGGVPGTVAGAAGALAVVMPQLTGSDGSLGHLPLAERIEHLFVALTIAGILQLLFGLLGFSKVFSMIPRTAHIGFLNGLALMMFLSQMTTFKVCTVDTMRFGECEVNHLLKWMKPSDPTTWTTFFLVVLTMIVMVGFPKIPVIGRLVPPTLAVAIIGVGFEHGINRPLLHYDVRTIGDTSPLSGGLPTFGFPEFSGVKNWSAVISCAASLAAVGLFESIMTLQAVVDLTKQRLTSEATKKECIAQGVGNILCGFFGAMGGCSMIGQSTGNILNGGRFRVSAIVGGITTFIVVLFASSVIELVPVACLTGILYVIIIHTFYWPSLKLIFHLQPTDAFAIIMVTALAAAINLAVAVIAGVIWQSLVNGWRSGQQLTMRATTEFVKVYHHQHQNSHNFSNEHDIQDPEHEDALVLGHEEAKVYLIKGHLLYSSISTFRPFFAINNDPALVILDFQECLFSDFSAVAALREAATRYHEAGKLLVARNLCAQSLDLLHHDLGWDHVESIQMPLQPRGGEVDVVEAGYASRQSSGEFLGRGSNVAPSPLPHLHLVSPFSPSATASPSTSYHVLQH